MKSDDDIRAMLDEAIEGRLRAAERMRKAGEDAISWSSENKQITLESPTDDGVLAFGAMRMLDESVGFLVKARTALPQAHAIVAAPRISGEMQCTFCGKTRQEVKNLVAGLHSRICDECIGLCNDIVAKGDQAEETKA